MLRLMLTQAATLTALLTSLLSAGPLQAQSTNSNVVTVSIVDDYPAFHREVTQRHPGARPLRALVFRRDGVRGDSTVILLHPAHANAETLRDALVILRRRASDVAAPRAGSPIPLFESGRVRPVDPSIRARLTTKLDELRATPKAPIRGRGRMGRSIVLSDVSQYDSGS